MSVAGGVLESGVAGPDEPARPAAGELPLGADVVVLPQVGAVRDLPDGDLVAALIETEAVGRRVDALRVALAAEVAERSRRELGPESVAARRACRTGVELVQRATGVARATALPRIRRDAGPDADLAELGRLADRRSRAQVLHDVLANAIAVAARATQTSSMAGAAPTRVVTVDAASLASGRGVAWVDGGPVDLAVARQTACAGAVERQGGWRRRPGGRGDRRARSRGARVRVR